VYLWSAFQLALAFMGQEYLGQNSIERYAIQAQTGDPDNDWSLLCDPCASGPWTYTAQFDVSPNNWQPFIPVDNLPGAVYTPGVGWEDNPIFFSGTNWQVWLAIEITFVTPVVINDITLNYNCTGNTSNSPVRQNMQTYLNNTQNSSVNNDNAQGNNLVMTSQPNTLVDKIEIRLRASSAINQSQGWSGQASFNSLTISGTGTIPPELT